MAWRIIKPNHDKQKRRERDKQNSQLSNDQTIIEKQQWDMYWSDAYIQHDVLLNLTAYQKVNHFPGMYLISNKIQLANSLKQMKKMFKQDYSIYPKSWVFPYDNAKIKSYFENKI